MTPSRVFSASWIRVDERSFFCRWLSSNEETNMLVSIKNYRSFISSRLNERPGCAYSKRSINSTYASAVSVRSTYYSSHRRNSAFKVVFSAAARSRARRIRLSSALSVIFFNIVPGIRLSVVLTIVASIQGFCASDHNGLSISPAFIGKNAGLLAS